jgi:hypothetical protein
MALSFTAAANNQTTFSATITCTLPVAVAAGDIVMVSAVGGGGGGVPSTFTMSDSSGDTYTDGGLGKLNLPWINASARIGAFLNPTVGVTQFTATMNASNDFIEIFAWKVSGFVATPTLDKCVQASGTGTAMDSGSSGTLTNAAEAAIGYCISENGATAAGSGWSTGGTNINDGISAFGDLGEHRITSATTAINATGTQNSGNWTALLLTAYDNTGGGGDTLFVGSELRFI